MDNQHQPARSPLGGAVIDNAERDASAPAFSNIAKSRETAESAENLYCNENGNWIDWPRGLEMVINTTLDNET